MKNYIKPCFTPITLSANGGSGACDIQGAHNGFELCAVDIPGVGNVFGGPNEILCDYDAGIDFGVCYFTAGPNTTVFGS